jgi:hypothetical protein
MDFLKIKASEAKQKAREKPYWTSLTAWFASPAPE